MVKPSRITSLLFFVAIACVTNYFIFFTCDLKMDKTTTMGNMPFWKIRRDFSKIHGFRRPPCVVGNASKIIAKPLMSNSSKVNVFVASHRRSGTHQLISLLSENFGSKINVLKISDHSPMDSFLGCDAFEWYRRNGRIVYAERDVEDVLVSLWHYGNIYATTSPLKTFIRENNSFSIGNCTAEQYGTYQCLRSSSPRSSALRSLNRPLYWLHHTVSWQQPGVLKIRFNDVKNDERRPGIVKALERHLGLESITLSKGKPILQPRPTKKTVGYRGGHTDGLNELGDADSNWIYDEIEKLGQFLPTYDDIPMCC